MPCHLISDAHEWINEIPTVPIYYLAKPQLRVRAQRNQRGKKTLLSLTLVRLCEITWEVQHKWEGNRPEIPLLTALFYLFPRVISFRGFCTKVIYWLNQGEDIVRWGVWLGRHIHQMVTWVPQVELKENRNLLQTERGKAQLNLIFSTNTVCESTAYRSFDLECILPEVTEKLPQGQLACGSQAFIATLPFDPSMSALPIIKKQNS
eukprot:TRINITY_DN43_c0_g1_i3.p1 TRINITY_DN43_c0_g1~~TRINITY_DN43_c0_g1_i3.p1  ORF type:complete len:206 (+),score=-34.61 TRINITY_DN43_c0_g1_i3:1607-2224(+)